MKIVLYLLIIGLFVLNGCNNQSLESTEQSVSKIHQVKISLGDDFSNRSNRYKGNYDDVINGGSVILHYSFPSSDNVTELQTPMKPTGSDWSVNLTLATGTYTFWANAYDSDGVQIFETDNKRNHPIGANTVLSLIHI